MSDEELLRPLNEIGKGTLFELIGMRFTDVGEGWIEAELHLRKDHLAPNGFLHAGAIVSVADSCCGVGCIRALPKGASGFTTIELKSNFLGTALEGVIEARAEARHLGRTTQIWDATVKSRETGKTLALFRCTQMVLWPR